MECLRPSASVQLVTPPGEWGGCSVVGYVSCGGVNWGAPAKLLKTINVSCNCKQLMLAVIVNN